MNYWELDFTANPKMPWVDILIAELAEIGFESFVDTPTGVQAYVSEDNLDEKAFMELYLISETPDELQLSFDKKFIPAQNWNATWESSFDPVQIGDQLIIAAPFHHDFPKTKHVIIIEPKMSFGTGHHQTTRLMSSAMLEMESMPEKVLDMGSGTGVLAILAEKLGAKEILAVDIEEWAYENAIENAARNNCSHIEVLHGDSSLIIDKQFDLILANINKNVLLADMQHFSNGLRSGGLLFLSGFFTSDNENLIDCAKKFNLAPIKSSSDEQWSCLVLAKQ